MPLFCCLVENQDEEFVKRITGSFLEVTTYIQKHKDLFLEYLQIGEVGKYHIEKNMIT